MAMTRIFTVTAERGRGDWWVLEAPGVASQVRRLDQGEDEMCEAVAHLAGPPESEVDVWTVPSEDYAEHVEAVLGVGRVRACWGSGVAGRRAVDGRGGGGCPNLPQRPLRGPGG